MSVYFTDKYRKIHDTLENSQEMTSLASNISDDMANSHNDIKNISAQIDSSTWIELGKTQLSGEFMQILSNQMGLLNKGVGVLSEAVNLAIGTLLPKLKSLKEKDEQLEELDQKIKSLGSAPNQYDSNNKVNPNYVTYVNTFNNLNETKFDLDKELKDLVSECDNTINNINGLKPEKIEVKMPQGPDEGAKYLKSHQSQNYLLTHSMLVGREGNMLNYGEYSVVDTPFGLVDYFNYIQKNRIYQDGSDATNACFSVAHFYGKSMLLSKKYSGSLATQVHSGAGDVFYRNKRLNDATQQQALYAIYEELKAGRPVSIDVKRKKPGGRHVVTVVGLKSHVKSAADLRPEDLLILDTWDGQIERMDTQTSRVMAAGPEVSQGYKGYRVNMVGNERLAEVTKARITSGMYA